jgi:hypothetical protein
MSGAVGSFAEHLVDLGLCLLLLLVVKVNVGLIMGDRNALVPTGTGFQSKAPSKSNPNTGRRGTATGFPDEVCRARTGVGPLILDLHAFSDS